ncbi:MAG: hypothetical protein JWO67_5560 [Streptosporangiaceae bacterium]|jgi:hypothetical protein|nr:hypothetical protein [Streptosporangiaceae bacterium]
MTLILIAACLAIAAAELSMARGTRRITGRLEKLEAIALVQDERIEAIAGRLGDAAPAPGERLDTGPAAGPTAETARLRERLDRLEDARRADENLFGRVTAAVDALDRLVADLLRHSLARLEEEAARALGQVGTNGAGECDTVRGTVSGPDPSARAALSKAYERWAGDTGLRIRFRATGPSGSARARYYLSGKAPRELERDFLALLESVRTEEDGGEPSGFRGVLRRLEEMPAGLVQIGPMVVARAPGTLLGGVLTLAECRAFDADALAGDPAEVARRLRSLPAVRMCDLTAGPVPAPEPPAEAGPVSSAPPAASRPGGAG